MVVAKDIMSRTIVSISPTAPVQDAVDMILECGVSGLPVIDRYGELVGIVSEADLCLLSVEDRAIARRVEDCMTRVVCTVDEDEPAEAIAELLMSKNIRRVPVTADGKVVGIVSRRDIVRGLKQGEEQTSITEA